MFRKRLRNALKSKPLSCEVRFCVVLNSDDMLFFPTEDTLRSYVSEYEKRLPIYSISLFKVVFYSLM